jgi:hypothetical protein
MFIEDYKDLINKIVKEEFKPFYSEEKRGVIKPLTENDNPNWSNINFINTHYSVFKKVVLPYLEKISGKKYKYEEDKTRLKSKNNNDLLNMIWYYRKDMFSPTSPLIPEIIDYINFSRKKGKDSEEKVELKLSEIYERVKLTSGDGSLIDFSGQDIIINGKTGQVKKVKSIKEGEKVYFVNLSQFAKPYKQDLFIFLDNEEKIWVFENKEVKIKNNSYLIGKDNLLKTIFKECHQE